MGLPRGGGMIFRSSILVRYRVGPPPNRVADRISSSHLNLKRESLPAHSRVTGNINGTPGRNSSDGASGGEEEATSCIPYGSDEGWQQDPPPPIVSTRAYALRRFFPFLHRCSHSSPALQALLLLPFGRRQCRRLLQTKTIIFRRNEAKCIFPGP